LPGDVNSDLIVASADNSLIRSRRELTVASGNYTPFCDINGDGIIRSASDTPGVPSSEDDRGFYQIYAFTSLPAGSI
jgi:hypothetical protein